MIRTQQDIANRIQRYDDMLYDSRPVKFTDFISNKYNIVHRKIYLYALNKYIKSYINEMISSEFLYLLFDAMSNISRTEDIYDEIMSNDMYKLLHDNINKLNIDDEEYVKRVIDIVITALTSVKQSIYNLDISSLSNIADISDFILEYSDRTYLFTETGENNEVTYQVIDGTFIGSEKESDENNEYNIDNDFIILLESDEYNKIHIGYNRDGKWYVKIDIDIPNFEQQIENLVSQANDNCVYNIRELCKKYFTKSHKFIEIKNSEYWLPSLVVIIAKRRPYTKTNVDLTPYWNWYQAKFDKHIHNIKLTEDVLYDSELVALNYVRGFATFRTKIDGITFDVDFDFITSGVRISDELSLKNTFTTLIRNT